MVISYFDEKIRNNHTKTIIKEYLEKLLNNISYTSDNLSPKEQIMYALEVLIKDIQHEIES